MNAQKLCPGDLVRVKAKVLHADRRNVSLRFLQADGSSGEMITLLAGADVEFVQHADLEPGQRAYEALVAASPNAVKYGSWHWLPDASKELWAAVEQTLQET